MRIRNDLLRPLVGFLSFVVLSFTIISPCPAQASKSGDDQGDSYDTPGKQEPVKGARAAISYFMDCDTLNEAASAMSKNTAATLGFSLMPVIAISLIPEQEEGEETARRRKEIKQKFDSVRSEFNVEKNGMKKPPENLFEKKYMKQGRAFLRAIADVFEMVKKLKGMEKSFFSAMPTKGVSEFSFEAQDDGTVRIQAPGERTSLIESDKMPTVPPVAVYEDGAWRVHFLDLSKRLEQASGGTNQKRLNRSETEEVDEDQETNGRISSIEGTDQLDTFLENHALRASPGAVNAGPGTVRFSTYYAMRNRGTITFKVAMPPVPHLVQRKAGYARSLGDFHLSHLRDASGNDVLGMTLFSSLFDTLVGQGSSRVEEKVKVRLKDGVDPSSIRSMEGSVEVQFPIGVQTKKVALGNPDSPVSIGPVRVSIEQTSAKKVKVEFLENKSNLLAVQGLSSNGDLIRFSGRSSGGDTWSGTGQSPLQSLVFTAADSFEHRTYSFSSPVRIHRFSFSMAEAPHEERIDGNSIRLEDVEYLPDKRRTKFRLAFPLDRDRILDFAPLNQQGDRSSSHSRMGDMYSISGRVETVRLYVIESP